MRPFPHRFCVRKVSSRTLGRYIKALPLRRAREWHNICPGTQPLAGSDVHATGEEEAARPARLMGVMLQRSAPGAGRACWLPRSCRPGEPNRSGTSVAAFGRQETAAAPSIRRAELPSRASTRLRRRSQSATASGAAGNVSLCLRPIRPSARRCFRSSRTHRLPRSGGCRSSPADACSPRSWSRRSDGHR